MATPQPLPVTRAAIETGGAATPDQHGTGGAGGVGARRAVGALPCLVVYRYSAVAPGDLLARARRRALAPS